MKALPIFAAGAAAFSLSTHALAGMAPVPTGKPDQATPASAPATLACAATPTGPKAWGVAAWFRVTNLSAGMLRKGTQINISYVAKYAGIEHRTFILNVDLHRGQSTTFEVLNRRATECRAEVNRREFKFGTPPAVR